MFYIFFLENFIDGIIPPKTPQKPLYKGGYGREGGGGPPHVGGMWGGVHNTVVYSPCHQIYILHPHCTTDHSQYQYTDYKYNESFKWVIHIVGV
jgi:hypothetical protein